MHGSPAFVSGALIAGKYRLRKNLGEGAMGVVWSAINEVTMGEVALKLIWKPEPEYRVRLLREARACGAIRHKNVIQIHDVGQTESGDPFLVMELLSGETLAELLARKRRLSPPEAAAIGRDVARGLAAAHAAGVIHRDLKPANIYLHHQPGEDLPVVKVLDFGVAKNLSNNDGLRTAAGGTVGSPMYMSPEQARRAPDIDALADIWSLGVVLFEMLTGDRPFRGEIAEILHQILDGDIPTVGRRIRRIDPDLDAIVAGCLTRDREQRLGPALEVARLLDEHAAPGSREPLPSLMEEAPSERILAASSSSPSASFSPSPAALGAPSSSSAGLTGPSSSGHGQVAAPLSSQPSPLGPARSRELTTRLPDSPVPRVGPQILGAPDDDAETHRMEPRMLPPPSALSADRIGPSGTIRIDPSLVEEAIAARGRRVDPPAAPPFGPASSAAPGPLSGTAPMPRTQPPPGPTSSTAPMLRTEPPAPQASLSPPARGRGKQALIVAAGFAVGLAGIAAAVIVVARGRTATAGALSIPTTSSSSATVAPAAATPATPATADAPPSATASAALPPSAAPEPSPSTSSTAPPQKSNAGATTGAPRAPNAVPRPTTTSSQPAASKCPNRFTVGCKKTDFNKL